MKPSRTILLALFLILVFSPIVLGATSQANRDDSLVFIGVSPVGLHLPTLFTTPVGLGFYMGDSWLVGVEYGRWKFDSTSETDAGDDEETMTGTWSNGGGYVKWFPGNSFYMMLAAHRRSWDIDAIITVTEEGTGNPIPVRVKVESAATVGTLGIGNQWMFDFGLTIGVDWLLLSGVLSENIESSINAVDYNALIDPADKKEAQDDLDQLGKDLNKISGYSGAVVLTLGFAF